MTRDEWMVLPGKSGLRIKRSEVVHYWPESGDKQVRFYTTVSTPGDPEYAYCSLAEFEALLFAPATPAPDETYRDAAVRFAEAWANEHVDVEEYGKARIAFLELHRERERHGG